MNNLSWLGSGGRIYPNVEQLNHRRTSGDLMDPDLDIS
jgi:hypothetical protein